jgi:hypothetical protein
VEANKQHSVTFLNPPFLVGVKVSQCFTEASQHPAPFSTIAEKSF